MENDYNSNQIAFVAVINHCEKQINWKEGLKIMEKYLKYLLLTGIMAVTASPAYVFSYDNLSSSKQPVGFRGVYWESSKSSHTYLFSVFDNVEGIETFNRELEILTLGSAGLSEIRYHFYHDQFYQVSIMLNSANDFQPLLDELIGAYGMPEKESGIHIWENKTVSIRLSPEGASISYLPILDRLKRKYNSR